MAKIMVFVMLALSVIAFGAAVITAVAVTAPAVHAEDGPGCGGTGQPACECARPNPPPYCTP